MIVQLSRGEARLRVNYGGVCPMCEYRWYGRQSHDFKVAVVEGDWRCPSCRRETKMRRATHLTLTFPANGVATQTFEAEAVCSPRDNFSRREGRKVALRKLLEYQPGELIPVWGDPTTLPPSTQRFSRSDRAALWRVVCPDLTVKATRMSNSASQ